MCIVLFSLRDYIETICQALEGTDCVLVPYYEVLPIIGPLVSYLCSKECLLKYLQFDFAGCEVFFNKMEEMDLVWNFFVLQFSPCTSQYQIFEYADNIITCILYNFILQTPPTYPVCRFGRYMGKNMSEFVIGNIIARERHFLDIAQNQKLHCWYLILNNN